ncbi:hypothetical protein WDZ11_22335 (plasmid) [Roseomonas mucosa]|uniref:hypothetical protein n=1 Tax=Roseomonas mucosa TaxID=207340 RepID=UPI0030CF926A
MRIVTNALAGVFLVGMCVGAAAQSGRPALTITGHIQGYSCMSLNLTHEQLMVFENLPPIFSAPDVKSQKIGVASASVIVASPMQVHNGFARVLHMDGRPGWMKADMLKPWYNVNTPSTRCTPAMMSNGRPGFDYTRPGG